MTETELDLARRLAAHPRWEWMAGMQFVCADNVEPADRIVEILDGGIEETGWGTKIRASHVPDLADAATQGCLGTLLDEASGGIVAVFPHPARINGWAIYRAGAHNGVSYSWACIDGLGEKATKGVALATALLSAWEEEPA